MQRVWFITGAGKGIGNAIAMAALDAGDCVISTTEKATHIKNTEILFDQLCFEINQLSQFH